MKRVRKLTRGDTFSLEVEITENGEYQTVDEMFLTVKESYSADEILFQKKIGDGIKLKDNKYLISIYPEDTNDFEYKQYVYDVEIIKGNIKKTLEVGILRICDEVTFAVDEV